MVFFHSFVEKVTPCQRMTRGEDRWTRTAANLLAEGVDQPDSEGGRVDEQRGDQYSVLKIFTCLCTQRVLEGGLCLCCFFHVLILA